MAHETHLSSVTKYANNDHNAQIKFILPLTQIGGAPVAFATRKDIAISSQFLHEMEANKKKYNL